MEVNFEDQSTKQEGLTRMVEYYQGERISGLTGWIVRTGLVHSRRAAEIVILVVVVLVLSIAAYVWLAPSGSSNALPPGTHLVEPGRGPARIEPI